MGDCDVPDCSGDSSIENSCSYCGYTYCSKHRLPEKHHCLSLSESNTLGPDFSNEIDLSESQSDKQFANETIEKSECNRCSDYTTADHDLCLECRREEQTISSKSPDVSENGSLESNGGQDQQEEDYNRSGGLLSKLKSLLQR